MKRRFITPQLREQMRQLEAQGKTRREIAKLLDVEPATVTKHLGSVRPYRGARIATG